MKKLLFILTLAFTVSLVACKDDEDPKYCIDCAGTEICEGDEGVDGETLTKEDLEASEAWCDLFSGFEFE